MIGTVRFDDDDELHPIDSAGFQAGGIALNVRFHGPRRARPIRSIEVYDPGGALVTRVALNYEVPDVAQGGVYRLTIDLWFHEIDPRTLDAADQKALR